MAKVDGEDWLKHENENALIDMWRAKPVLCDVTCKGYSNRNQCRSHSGHSWSFQHNKYNHTRVDAVTTAHAVSLYSIWARPTTGFGDTLLGKKSVFDGLWRYYYRSRIRQIKYNII